MTINTVPRYDSRRAYECGDRAIVVGGSVSGLLAARVLADCFSDVVVVERDAFPSGPESRTGAPQTNHPHALLEAGRRTLEDLFPGFGESLVSAGGLLIDASTRVGHYAEGGFLADGASRLPMYCASRPLFEHVIREQVRTEDTVTLRGNCNYIDFTVDGRRRVTGVVFRDETGDEDTLDGDLVVDATGRTSRTPNWLEEHGYRAPVEDRVTVEVQYRAIRIERPPTDRRAFLVPPSSPRTRGVYVIPIEGDRWEVLLQGVHGDEPPTDPEGFVEFAKSLPVDEIGELIAEQPWTSEEIHGYPFPASLRRRYEDLAQFPDGLVVTGDAVASFNPIYGQGMSVAALDALALHRALVTDGCEDIGHRFFAHVGNIVDTVWQLAVGSDFEFSQTTGPKPRGTDLFNRYVSRLLRKAHTDPVLSEAFARVLLLEHGPRSLLRPRLVWRTLRPSTGDAANVAPTPSQP